MGVVFWYGHCIPSPSSLCSATSPKGRGKGGRADTDLVLSYHMKSNDTRTGRCLALPLGELAPEAAERVRRARAACTLSVFAALRHLSQRERQEWVRERQGVVRLALPLGELSPEVTERALPQGHKKETPEGVSLFAGVSGRKSQITCWELRRRA